MSRNKKTFYAGLTSKHAPIDDSNIGRKMLEKMGWSNGLGLGKDNKGSKDILHFRHKVCRTGFRTKDEICQDTLPHQSAFENLLGELTCTTEEKDCNGAVDSSSPNVLQTYKRQIRYSKMARAKDITNYAKKDLEGILGKESKKLTLNEEYAKCIYSEVNGASGSENMKNVGEKACKNSSGKNFEGGVTQYNHLQNNELYNAADGSYIDDGSESITYPKKTKRKKKLKSFQAESNIVDYGESENVDASETEGIIEPSHLLIALDSPPEKKDFILPKKSKANKKKRKEKDLTITNSKKNAAEPMDIANEEKARKQNGTQQCDFEEKQKWDKDIVNNGILSKKCSGFLGSNIDDIKGYGNW